MEGETERRAGGAWVGGRAAAWEKGSREAGWGRRGAARVRVDGGEGCAGAYPIEEESRRHEACVEDELLH